jgi:hypothetical protein
MVGVKRALSVWALAVAAAPFAIAAGVSVAVLSGARDTDVPEAPQLAPPAGEAPARAPEVTYEPWELVSV